MFHTDLVYGELASWCETDFSYYQQLQYVENAPEEDDEDDLQADDTSETDEVQEPSSSSFERLTIATEADPSTTNSLSIAGEVEEGLQKRIDGESQVISHFCCSQALFTREFFC